MAKLKRPCLHPGPQGKHFHTSSRAARKCALAAKRRKGGKAWSDSELGV